MSLRATTWKRSIPMDVILGSIAAVLGLGAIGLAAFAVILLAPQ
jgi:hypothetical protein